MSVDVCWEEGGEDIFVGVIVPVYRRECTKITVIVRLNLPGILQIGSIMTTFLVSLFYPLFIQGFFHTSHLIHVRNFHSSPAMGGRGGGILDSGDCYTAAT